MGRVEEAASILGRRVPKIGYAGPYILALLLSYSLLRGLPVTKSVGS